jgi:RNA polymerase sigma-70 factor (ECF subfamily)
MSQIAPLAAHNQKNASAGTKLSRNCPMQSDAQIVRQVRAGDRPAYGILVERYERMVRATALRHCGNHHAAEDASQEAFVIGLKRLEALRDPERFGGWILAIARRTAGRWKARAARGPIYVGDLETLGGGEPLSTQSRELLELVERLPAQEQSVVALRYLNGHSVGEIAEITARPLGTVTKQLSRACQRLQNWLAEEVNR